MAMKPDDLFLLPTLAQDQAGAARSDIPSTVRLGYRYMSGSAGKVDVKQAYNYFRAMDPASPIATAWRGYIDARSTTDSVKKQGAQRLQAVSQSGDPVGQTLLGRAYELGLGGLPPNPALARQLYTAAQGQFALAKTYLGQALLQTGDINGAWHLLQDAAAAGEIVGMVTMARLYLSKVHDPKAIFAAKGLLKTAAGRGDMIALYRLGSLYSTPFGGTPAKSHLAFWLLRQSATLGYGPAQMAVSIAYANGIGVKPSLGAGAFWMSKAMAPR